MAGGCLLFPETIRFGVLPSEEKGNVPGSVARGSELGARGAESGRSAKVMRPGERVGGRKPAPHAPHEAWSRFRTNKNHQTLELPAKK